MSDDDDHIMINTNTNLDLGLTDSTYYVGDNLDVDTITIKDTDSWYSSVADTFTFTGVSPPASIKIGDTTLDENAFKKLQALLDLIENLDDEHQLKQLLMGQLALNELGK